MSSGIICQLSYFELRAIYFKYALLIPKYLGCISYYVNFPVIQNRLKVSSSSTPVILCIPCSHSVAKKIRLSLFSHSAKNQPTHNHPHPFCLFFFFLTIYKFTLFLSLAKFCPCLDYFIWSSQDLFFRNYYLFFNYFTFSVDHSSYIQPKMARTMTRNNINNKKESSADPKLTLVISYIPYILYSIYSRISSLRITGSFLHTSPQFLSSIHFNSVFFFFPTNLLIFF